MSRVAAQRLARELRRDLEITARDFDLLTLLADLDITICYEKPAGTAEAMSLTYGNIDLIVIDPALSTRRRRFSLCHELGHILLGHGASRCTPNDIHGKPTNPQEEAADAFSASLLLPTKLFRQDIKTVHPRINELSILADRYQVSFTATAIRYSQFTNDPCALIGSRPPATPRITKTTNLGWWLTLPPPDNTLTASHLATDNTATTAQTSAQLWINDFPWQAPTFLTEQVIQTSPTTWLTLLSDFPDPDDDPDLIDREAQEELERRRHSFRRY